MLIPESCIEPFGVLGFPKPIRNNRVLGRHIMRTIAKRLAEIQPMHDDGFNQWRTVANRLARERDDESS